MNGHSYQYYQYQQLEPESRLVVGNAKRWGLLSVQEPRRVVELQEAIDVVPEEESDRVQDEYLALHGAG